MSLPCSTSTTVTPRNTSDGTWGAAADRWAAAATGTRPNSTRANAFPSRSTSGAPYNHASAPAPYGQRSRLDALIDLIRRTSLVHRELLRSLRSHSHYLITDGLAILEPLEPKPIPRQQVPFTGSLRHSRFFLFRVIHRLILCPGAIGANRQGISLID